MFAETCWANWCSFLYHELDSLKNHALEELLTQWYSSVMSKFCVIFPRFDDEHAHWKLSAYEHYRQLRFGKNDIVSEVIRKFRPFPIWRNVRVSSSIENVLQRFGSGFSVLFLFWRLFFVVLTWSLSICALETFKNREAIFKAQVYDSFHLHSIHQ
jgi:hypothetical protein